MLADLQVGVYVGCVIITGGKLVEVKEYNPMLE
jgi:hypothetical protein